MRIRERKGSDIDDAKMSSVFRRPVGGHDDHRLIFVGDGVDLHGECGSDWSVVRPIPARKNLRQCW